MTISKCARCAQCDHCSFSLKCTQTVHQVHECAHLKVVVSKQLPIAHCVHTRAHSAQRYTKTFLMSTLIFFCTNSHSISQATAGLVAAGRLHGHQAALSAATATCRLHLYLSRTFWAASSWRWPPTASTEPSPMNGTICRVLITPEECVIPRTGRAVGASSSTSILGL